MNHYTKASNSLGNHEISFVTQDNNSIINDEYHSHPNLSVVVRGRLATDVTSGFLIVLMSHT